MLTVLSMNLSGCVFKEIIANALPDFDDTLNSKICYDINFDSGIYELAENILNKAAGKKDTISTKRQINVNISPWYTSE